ncbi:MAG: hypothetical protein HOE44_15905 [Candidatus Marinimicrobia bacterium]|nr:hypothetical protein [Candidatus Neomarinimicrobiota bacterium]MBT5466979.1 hypothetical protein [Candidatus Neomarinimicrobiota bacterium]MBT7831742.1 hypothetical protein [Candidatus Neomarinimicrobiota bacterium]
MIVLTSPYFCPTIGGHLREQRISNFLLWQMAYCELYFTDLYWPEFDRNALDKAVNSFAERQRRFGRTGDQLIKKAEK